MNNNVFTLSYDDFASILGRELTDDEKLLISSKFAIDDWSDYVKTFLDVYEIK